MAITAHQAGAWNAWHAVTAARGLGRCSHLFGLFARYDGRHVAKGKRLQGEETQQSAGIDTADQEIEQL